MKYFYSLQQHKSNNQVQSSRVLMEHQALSRKAPTGPITTIDYKFVYDSSQHLKKKHYNFKRHNLLTTLYQNNMVEYIIFNFACLLKIGW